jgi:predicted CopG family antitoxin
MHKKLTITLDEKVYEGLYRVIGRRNISRFLEELARPHVIPTDIEEAYRQMAADEEREAKTMEWTEGLIGDVADDTR